MLTHVQIRQKRMAFRENKGHKHAKPVSLVADSENKSVLFTVAGMQQFVPYLVGKKHPLGARLYNIQKCIRTNDIDDIGDERHCSMFEMMGNRSLGDYFKKEAIGRTLEFLTQEMGIELSKIGVTIFHGDTKTGIPRDDESFQTAQALGIQHIKEIWFNEQGESDNFWTPWPVGPCGPCVEFYYDRGDQYGPADRDMWVNDRYTEVRNNVMMSYYQQQENNQSVFSPLPQKNVDTGMWLERLCMIAQWTETIFETDLFASCREIIAAYTDTNYSDYLQSYRIILDHFRAATFLICDGIIPSNEGRWYVLRRLIRRWYFNLTKLCTQDPIQLESFLKELVVSIVDQYTPWYESCLGKQEVVVSILHKECQHFQQTIHNGIQELDKIIQHKQVNGATTFTLFESYWLPRDVIKDILVQHNIVADKDAFDKEFEKAREKSRQSVAFVKNTERSKYLSWVSETHFVWYDNLRSDDCTLIKDFTTEQWQRVLVFDKTPFYATWWWQIGDRWTIIWDNGEEISIREVIKYAWVYLHLV